MPSRSNKSLDKISEVRPSRSAEVNGIRGFDVAKAMSKKQLQPDTMVAAYTTIDRRGLGSQYKI